MTLCTSLEGENPKRSPSEWDTFDQIAPGLKVGRLPECWIEDVVEMTRTRLSKDTASADAMRLVRRTNDSSFWGLFARADDRPHILAGYFAQLLLNGDGFKALLERSLDLKNPERSYLAHTGERPAAVYLWGVVAEKKTAIFQPFLTQQLTELSGLPHYATLATEGGLKIGREFGLRPVTPADDRIGGLYVFPRRNVDDVTVQTSQKSEPSIRVKTVTTAEEMEQARAVRAAVFMSEQKCPYEEEFDGNDYSACHLIAFVDEAPAATMRIRFFADWVKLERMAVLEQFRRSAVKKDIIEYAFELVRRKGYRRCYGQAQRRLLNFWLSYGFQVFPRNAEIQFSDHDYVEIWRDLDPHPEALNMSSDPMVINRPEGQWDVVGVLERSSLRPATRCVDGKAWLPASGYKETFAMSKSIACAAAVGDQLRREHHWPPNNLNKVMAADYHYDKNTIALFLVAVQASLKGGAPSYKFTFDDAFQATALTSTVGVLIGNVSANTA